MKANLFHRSCDVGGNERADELAKEGAKMNQNEVPITHNIVKAKINLKKWTVEHERAKMMFKDRRTPRWDIEVLWPRRVCTLYSRLRSQHAMELRWYTHFKIQKDESPFCEECDAIETIQHVLCECPALLEVRVRQWEGR